MLGGCGPRAGEAVSRLLETVAPGGWVQLAESTHEPVAGNGPAMRDFIALLRELFDAVGTGNSMATQLPGWLKGAGFDNVETSVFPYHVGARLADPTLRRMSIDTMCIAADGLIKWASGKLVFVVLVDGIKSKTLIRPR